MADQETSRLSRLTAIVTLLQSKRLITSTDIADKFGVSVRTAYRDIKALEEAGIPIYTLEGKGYSLVEGYTLPPVMFSEIEANALITAQRLISQNKDASLVNAYNDAVTKIKAILRYSNKDKADLLAKRVVFRQNQDALRTSDNLTQLQLAITNFTRCKILYQKINANETTTRKIEPFALYNTQENWVLIAYCLLRKEYRAFRLDRIKSLNVLSEHFEPSGFTLQDYFEECRKKTKNNP